MELSKIGKTAETKGLKTLLADVGGMSFKTVEYDCPIHGKQIYEIPSASKSEPMCPVCAAIAKEKERVVSEAKAESRIRAKEILDLMHLSYVEDEAATFDRYNPECEKAEKALMITRRFAENFSDRESMRLEAFENQRVDRFKQNSVGLFFFGKSGTGKTHLASSIIAELRKQGWGSIYMTAQEFVTGYASIYRFEERARLMNLLSMIPVLIIDEIGRQRNTEKEQAALWQLINDRVRLGRPMVLISNFDWEELSNQLDDSVRDRLRSQTYPILFSWKSHRKTVARELSPMDIF